MRVRMITQLSSDRQTWLAGEEYDLAAAFAAQAIRAKAQEIGRGPVPPTALIGSHKHFAAGQDAAAAPISNLRRTVQ